MLLAGLAPIISEWAEWHVLQKDIRDRDQEALRERALIENHAHHPDDFADTAALSTQMDLMISMDTSVADSRSPGIRPRNCFAKPSTGTGATSSRGLPSS